MSRQVKAYCCKIKCVYTGAVVAPSYVVGTSDANGIFFFFNSSFLSLLLFNNLCLCNIDTVCSSEILMGGWLNELGRWIQQLIQT